MKICRWNVNFIRQRTRPNQDMLSPWLAEHRPDVVCLQELQCTPKQFPHAILRDAGYRAVVFAEKGKNGVAILTRLDAPEPRAVAHAWPPATGAASAVASEARFIAAEVRGVVVGSAYVPYGRAPDDPQWQHKQAFLAALKLWAQGVIATGQCLVLAGDFNVAPSAQDAPSETMLAAVGLPAPEKLWPAWCHELFRAALRDLCSVGLQDVGAVAESTPRPFTMWDERNFLRGSPYGVRVDLLLASAPMAARLLGVATHSSMRDGVKPSDHVPVEARFADVERIFATLGGSKLYGLASEASDTDIWGLTLPSRDDLLLGRVSRAEHVQRNKPVGEKNDAHDIDVLFHSPTQFVLDLMAGQPCAWEMLHAPEMMWTADTQPAGRRFLATLRANSAKLWPTRLALLAIKQGRTSAQNTSNEIRAARAALLSLTGERPLAPPADDSFGLGCVKEMYDQHLMVAPSLNAFAPSNGRYRPWLLCLTQHLYNLLFDVSSSTHRFLLCLGSLILCVPHFGGHTIGTLKSLFAGTGQIMRCASTHGLVPALGPPVQPAAPRDARGLQAAVLASSRRDGPKWLLRLRQKRQGMQAVAEAVALVPAVFCLPTGLHQSVPAQADRGSNIDLGRSQEGQGIAHERETKSVAPLRGHLSRYTP